MIAAPAEGYGGRSEAHPAFVGCMRGLGGRSSIVVKVEAVAIEILDRELP
jgi:hypothetical protein